MRRRASVITALLLLLSWGGPGCKGPDASASGAEVVAVEAVPVEIERLTTTAITPESTALGHLEPWRFVVVQAELAGRVEGLHAAEGDSVATGAPLATLDRTLLDAQLDVAKTAVRQGQVALRQARRERDRLRRLESSGAIASARFDDAEDAVAAAQAAIETARARVALVERQIEHAAVAAPFAGVVTEKHVEVGALVGPGVPLYTLQELQRLKAVASFPPDAIRGVEPGAPAHVSVPALDVVDLVARVHRIADAADPRTRRVPVEVALERATLGGSGESLRPGLAVRVALPHGAPSDHVLAPRSAVVERFGAPYAFVVEGERAVLRRLELGAAHGARVEVRAGLAVGEALVVAGQERLTDGAAVRVVDAAPPGAPSDAPTPPTPDGE